MRHKADLNPYEGLTILWCGESKSSMEMSLRKLAFPAREVPSYAKTLPSQMSTWKVLTQAGRMCC